MTCLACYPRSYCGGYLVYISSSRHFSTRITYQYNLLYYYPTAPAVIVCSARSLFDQDLIYHQNQDKTPPASEQDQVSSHQFQGRFGSGAGIDNQIQPPYSLIVDNRLTCRKAAGLVDDVNGIYGEGIDGPEDILILV